MDKPNYVCNTGLLTHHTSIFSGVTRNNKSINDYIDEFNNKITNYKNQDTIKNNDIISILSNAVNIFKIVIVNSDVEYNYNYILSIYLYNKIISFLSTYDKSTYDKSTYDTSYIDTLISSYKYFEECLNKKNLINIINIIDYLNAIKTSLNRIKTSLKDIKELEDIITKYIKKDIKKDIKIDIQEDINNYCSNIYFFYNKIVKNNNNNNEEFQKAYDEFQKCIKNTTPNISSIKKSKKPIFSIFSKKAKTIPITNDIDNCFLSFYRKIIAIYKNSNYSDYSDYSDYIINIKTFLFYIGNLHYIYKKVNNITKKYEHDEEPPILQLKYFLFVKLGGKNKSEFINYKYEDKIYKRKIRHDGKKIYIIINKQKIFIKKLK